MTKHYHFWGTLIDSVKEIEVISGLTNHAAGGTVTTPNNPTEAPVEGKKRSFKLSDTLEEAVDENQR